MRNEGNFFEDFSIGQVFQHPLGRTIYDADNAWFTLMTMNTNELHFNADFAQLPQQQRPQRLRRRKHSAGRQLRLNHRARK